MKTLILILPLITCLSACSLITVPLKVAGKVATTTVELAGKAAGAGIDAMKKDDPEDEH